MLRIPTQRRSSTNGSPPAGMEFPVIPMQSLPSLRAYRAVTGEMEVSPTAWQAFQFKMCVGVCAFPGAGPHVTRIIENGTGLVELAYEGDHFLFKTGLFSALQIAVQPFRPAYLCQALPSPAGTGCTGRGECRRCQRTNRQAHLLAIRRLPGFGLSKSRGKGC